MGAGIDAAEWDGLYEGVPPNDEQRAEAREDATICASSFESFLYRFRLEIRIGYRLDGFDDAPRTDAERRCLAHYETGQHLRAT